MASKQAEEGRDPGGARKGPSKFSLEEMFPDLDHIFDGGSDVDPNSDCLVALDSSALLLPYKVTKAEFSELSGALEKLRQQGRLVLPERVAREFIRNRSTVLVEMLDIISKAKKGVNIELRGIPSVLESHSKAADLKAARKNLTEAMGTYFKLLDDFEAEVRTWRGDDPVTALYKRLFTQEALIRPEEAPDALSSEWETRLRMKVPPGYTDGNKLDGGIGDFIIWKSILAAGKRYKKDLIFVTHEKKEDWFVSLQKDANKEPIFPRPELLDEYRRASNGKSLALSSLNELLKKRDASDELVRAVVAAAQQRAADEWRLHSTMSEPNRGVESSQEVKNFTIAVGFGEGVEPTAVRPRVGVFFSLNLVRTADDNIILLPTHSMDFLASFPTDAFREGFMVPAAMPGGGGYSPVKLGIGDAFVAEDRHGNVLAGVLDSLEFDVDQHGLHQAFFSAALFRYNDMIRLPWL